MKLGVDLGPLRSSPQFRRLYFARFYSGIGNQMTYVVTAYQLRLLTHSTLAVGSLGLVEVIPILVLGLYGGVLADHLDRRVMVVTTEVVLGVLSVALLVNTLWHPHAWVLYVVDALVVSAGSLQTPSLVAMRRLIVRHDEQRAAATLGAIRDTTATLVAPAVGGLLAVLAGPATAYVVTVVAFGVSVPMLASLQRPPRGGGEGDVVTSLREGLRYTRSRPDLLGTYLVDLLAMAWAYPVIMLPFVAATFRQRDALALLYMGLPLGSMLATLSAGWARHVRRYGRAIVAAAAVWGLGIALFGFANSLALDMVGLVIAGGADGLSGIFRTTMWNESIPPDVRGRLAGVELISYALGPTTGQLRSGWMAAWWTLRASLGVGGLVATASVGAVAASVKRLWSFDARHDPHVAEVARLRGAA